MNSLKIKKGEAGYIESYRLRKLLLSLLFLALIIGSALTGFIIFKTMKNILSVAACCLSLPFAKAFIAYIMTIKMKGLPHSDTERMRSVSDNILYDITVSDEERIIFIKALYIDDEHFLALTGSDAGFNDILKQQGYMGYIGKREIRTYGSADEFLSAVSGCIEASGQDKKAPEELISYILDKGL